MICPKATKAEARGAEAAALTARLVFRVQNPLLGEVTLAWASPKRGRRYMLSKHPPPSLGPVTSLESPDSLELWDTHGTGLVPEC